MSLALGLETGSALDHLKKYLEREKVVFVEIIVHEQFCEEPKNVLWFHLYYA